MFITERLLECVPELHNIPTRPANAAQPLVALYEEAQAAHRRLQARGEGGPEGGDFFAMTLRFCCDLLHPKTAISVSTLGCSAPADP